MLNQVFVLRYGSSRFILYRALYIVQYSLIVFMWHLYYIHIVFLYTYDPRCNINNTFGYTTFYNDLFFGS